MLRKFSLFVRVFTYGFEFSLLFTGNDVIQVLAVSDSESGKIYIYDGKGEDKPIHVLDKIHSDPVKFIEVCRFTFEFDLIIF